jgi:hypothetical protein
MNMPQLPELPFLPETQEQRIAMVRWATDYGHQVRLAAAKACDEQSFLVISRGMGFCAGAEACRDAILTNYEEGNKAALGASEMWHDPFCLALLRGKACNCWADAPSHPPECKTEEEKRAFCFGWFKAKGSQPGDPKSERDLAIAQHGWQRECNDADELLRLMFPAIDPGDFRTDGGSINLSHVRAALSGGGVTRFCADCRTKDECKEFGCDSAA